MLSASRCDNKLSVASWSIILFGDNKMRIHSILIALAALGASHILPVEGQISATEARSLDPDSPDIISRFHRIGLPKYTDIEKRIIDRAKSCRMSRPRSSTRSRLGIQFFIIRDSWRSAQFATNNVDRFHTHSHLEFAPTFRNSPDHSASIAFSLTTRESFRVSPKCHMYSRKPNKSSLRTAHYRPL